MNQRKTVQQSLNNQNQKQLPYQSNVGINSCKDFIDRFFIANVNVLNQKGRLYTTQWFKSERDSIYKSTKRIQQSHFAATLIRQYYPTYNNTYYSFSKNCQLLTQICNRRVSMMKNKVKKQIEYYANQFKSVFLWSIATYIAISNILIVIQSAHQPTTIIKILYPMLFAITTLLLYYFTLYLSVDLKKIITWNLIHVIIANQIHKFTKIYEILEKLKVDQKGVLYLPSAINQNLTIFCTFIIALYTLVIISVVYQFYLKKYLKREMRIIRHDYQAWDCSISLFYWQQKFKQKYYQLKLTYEQLSPFTRKQQLILKNIKDQSW